MDVNLGKGRYLGTLCLRGHEFDGTGQTARSASGHCIECARLRRGGKPQRGLQIGAVSTPLRRNEMRRKRYAQRRKVILARLREKRLRNLDAARCKEKEQKARMRKSGSARKSAAIYRAKNVVRVRLRGRIFNAIQRYAKAGKICRAQEYGIDIPAIVQHLGACPGERSEWHIDHVKPLAMFDFDDSLQIKEAFAPTNHQWLPAALNRSKGARWVG